MDDFTIHPPDSGFTIHPPTAAPLAQSTGLTIHPPEQGGQPGLLQRGGAELAKTESPTGEYKSPLTWWKEGVHELADEQRAITAEMTGGKPIDMENGPLAKANFRDALGLATGNVGKVGLDLLRGGAKAAGPKVAAAAKPIQGEASTFTISEPSLHKVSPDAVPGETMPNGAAKRPSGLTPEQEAQLKAMGFGQGTAKQAEGIATQGIPGAANGENVAIKRVSPDATGQLPSGAAQRPGGLTPAQEAELKARGFNEGSSAGAGSPRVKAAAAQRLDNTMAGIDDATKMPRTTGETIPLRDPVMPEGPLSRAPALTKPREFEDQLHQLSTNTAADAIEATKKTEALPPEATPEVMEKLYHYVENPSGKPLYHGTQAEFDGLPRSDAELGPHYTVDRDTAAGFSEGKYGDVVRIGFSIGKPRVVEAEGRFANALKLPDLKTWEPDKVAKYLVDKGIAPRELIDKVNSAAPGWVGHLYASAPELAKRNKVVTDFLRSKGYDAISYKNEFEGGAEAFIPLDEARVRKAGSGITLSPAEQKIFDEHIAPIRTERAALSKELEGITGIKQEHADEYTPRRVKGRTRSLGEVLEQWKAGVEAKFGGAQGRSLRKTVDSQKSRKFYNAVNPETGEKQVVWVSPDREVVAFDGSKSGKQLGRLAGNTGAKSGAKVSAGGQTLTLEQATTKEIESVAKTRYTKNIFANELDELMKARAAVRNAKFLEDVKAHPDFDNVAIKATETSSAPVVNGRQWRVPKLMQFRQYYMEPRLADALDDFAKDMAHPEGIANTLQKIGKVMNYVMFLNPKAHIDNVFNHMMVDRGLVGNVLGAPSAAKNLIKAARQVLTAGPEYIRLLRTGASLPYSKMLSGDLHKTLIRKLGGEAERDPHVWNSMAQSFGYLNAKDMLMRWGNVPQRALWAASDIMTMAREMELRAKGISIEQAIKKTEEGMPNYRVPGQVMGKRWIAQIFGSPAIGRFGRYQYGRLRGYGHMLKDAFGKGRSLHDRAEAFDKMAMLGAYMFLFYPVFDKAWQAVTGNDNAKTTRSGAATIPQVALDVINGDKKPGDAAQSIFTLGVPIETPVELYYGRYLWSGQPIIHEADVEAGRYGRVAKDAAGYVASKASQVGQMFDVSQGKKTPRQLLYEAIGVKTPTEEQVEGKAKAKMYEKRNAQKRDMRLTNKASGE